MHEPHSSGVRRITHFVRVEVVMRCLHVTPLSVALNRFYTVNDLLWMFMYSPWVGYESSVTHSIYECFNPKIISCLHVTPLSVALTVIPVKPWTPEKIYGMIIVLRPIRSEMKPQKITAKPWEGFFFLDKSSILPFSNTEIVLFVFQLIYVQRVDMNDMFSDIFTGKRYWIE